MSALQVLASLALLAAASGNVVKTASTNPGTFELLILHNNDMHARFEQTSQLSGACTTADRDAGKCYGGFPRVAHVVKEARKAAASGEGPPVLYLNAGDTYTGTAWFTIYKWKIAAEFINALQPDAVSLGNHEFDNGVNGLTPFIENLACPVLAANLVLTKVPELESISNLKKSIVIDIDDTKIGIFGYLTPETKLLAVKNHVDYISEVEALKLEVSKLKDKGVHIIIALGHSGYTKDLEIAREVDGIDLVIGGHTNTFLWNGSSPDSENPVGPYPTIVKQSSGRKVPVVQAYAYTKYLGKLHIQFDLNGEILHLNGTPVLLDNSVPQDPDVLRIIHHYKGDKLNVADEVVGNTSVILDGLSCQRYECNLGNLITDSMISRYASHYRGKYWTDASIAIIQGGGIRSSIAHAKLPATVTKGDLLTVMPFEGKLAAVTVNGTVLIRMLEHSVAKYDSIDNPGEFLQLSGIKVLYNLKKSPGSRVVKAYARCWKCDIPRYYTIHIEDVFKVLMPEFLSNGGDGFTMFKGLPTVNLPYDELMSTQHYIRHHSPIYPEVDGRITILNEVMQTDSTSLGNHEFDENVDGLIPFIQNISSPVLAANLILNKVPQLQKEENLKKSIVITINGVKVGIIGYLTPETKHLAPRNAVEYEDEVIALKREVKNLKKQGVNILVALGHSGFLEDLKIAKEVDGIDLVIGGHSNTFLINNDTNEIPEQPQGPYPTMVKQDSGKSVPVVQAYAYTKYMGRLYLVFDSYGELIHYDGEPILLNRDIPRDIDVYKMVKKYHDDVERVSGELVGTSSVLLNGHDCRLKQCNIGNLITDAILSYAKETLDTCTNIAIVQGGRIRSSIDHQPKPYQMTRGDWFTVLPFTDGLLVVTMNGSVLLKALEHSVDTWRTVDSTGQFLQFSGMKVVYDLSKAPGKRIVSAKAKTTVNKLRCEESDLLDIRESSEYNVIMPSFLALGGDGYTMFLNLTSESTTYGELPTVFKYLSLNNPVNPTLSDRLILMNEDKIDKNFLHFQSSSNRDVRLIKTNNSWTATLSIKLEVIYLIVYMLLR